MFSRNEQKLRGMPSIIAADLTITGDLVSEGDVHVEGTVNGDVRCRTLSVGEHGIIAGQVSGDLIRVRGEIVGQIDAMKVELASTARIKGDILHESVAVEAGAQIDGHLRRRAPQPTLNLIRSDVGKA